MSGSTNPAAQPGRPSDGLGTGPARRAAHRHRRQCRRPSDAARPGRSVHRRRRPHDANGDVANKIGTYLKALAARDNGVPFYVALPSSTIDWQIATARRSRSSSATRARSRISPAGPRRAGGSRACRLPRQPGGEFRLRRDPRAAGDRADHRARRCPASREGLLGLFPEGERNIAAE